MEYSNPLSFLVEYLSGLINLSRSQHLPLLAEESEVKPPPLKADQVDFPIDGGRTIRVDTKSTPMVIIDVQKFVFRLQMWVK